MNKKKRRSNLRSDCHTCRPPQQQKQTTAALAVQSPPPWNSDGQAPAPQTSALAANAVYRAEGNPRAPQHFANNVAGGSQILLKREPDAPPRPTRSHPAISGQRGGHPVKMSTGPAVNPGGCSVISGGPGGPTNRKCLAAAAGVCVCVGGLGGDRS